MTGGDPPRDAMKEVELLQEIIARHEKHAFTVKALLATALTGLAALVFGLDKRLEPIEIGVLGAIAIVAFGLWALAHSALVVVAVQRVTEIEASIRSPATTPYDGPRIAESLARPGSRAFWNAGIYRTNLLPLLIAVLVVGAIAWGEQRFRRDARGGDAPAADAADTAGATGGAPLVARAALPLAAGASPPTPADIARFVGEGLAAIESSTLDGDRFVARATLPAARCEIVARRRPGAGGVAWSVDEHRCEAPPPPLAPADAAARVRARAGRR